MLVNTQTNLLLMNFEPIKYDYTLEEDRAPMTKTPTPPPSSASSTTSATKRQRMNMKRRQSSALKAIEQSETIKEKEKSKKSTILFDNENIGLDPSLEETKELLKRQIRGGVDEKRKLVPEEYRLIQQSPFYRADKSNAEKFHRK